jgi:hypothetical protein
MKHIFLLAFLFCSVIVFSQTDTINSDSLEILPQRIHSDEVELKLFPNPASKNTTLEIKIKIAQYLKIDLTDLDGTIIRTIASQMFNNSVQSVYIETYGLSKGSYFISVKSESGVEINSVLLKIER